MVRSGTVRIHARRARGAMMSYHRPHITTNASGEVTQFTWAPAFEGPLPVTSGPDVGAYYSAYGKMLALINYRMRVTLIGQEQELNLFKFA